MLPSLVRMTVSQRLKPKAKGGIESQSFPLADSALQMCLMPSRSSWFRRMIQARWSEPALDESDERQPEPS